MDCDHGDEVFIGEHFVDGEHPAPRASPHAVGAQLALEGASGGGEGLEELQSLDRAGTGVARKVERLLELV